VVVAIGIVSAKESFIGLDCAREDEFAFHFFKDACVESFKGHERGIVSFRAGDLGRYFCKDGVHAKACDACELFCCLCEFFDKGGHGVCARGLLNNVLFREISILAATISGRGSAWFVVGVFRSCLRIAGILFLLRR